MLKITKARVSDTEAFYAFFTKSLKEGYFIYPTDKASYITSIWLPKKSQLKKNIKSGKKLLYLASENEKIIGYLLVNRIEAGVSFGDWLAVDSFFRKKGIASRLLSAWEKDVLKNNGHALSLYTTKNNVTFYQKRGFTLGGSLPKSWFGIDHYLFYKTLRDPKMIGF